MDVLAEIFHKWAVLIDFPATVLLVLVLMGAYVVYKTQTDPNNNFDFADMLRDDSGKPSALRLMIFPCMAISSWVIMYVVVSKQAIDLWLIVLYMLIWSGAKIADKMVDAYIVSKGGSLPSMPQAPSESSDPTK